MRSFPPSVSSRRLRWFLALPKLGVVLLLAAVVTLLWLLHQSELEEERSGLIKDVLWLEQNVRFHLARSEEQLQQLAADLGSQPDSKRIFRIRASHIVKNNPDIAQIVWFDAQHRVIDALPATTPADSGVDAFGPAATQKAFELAILLNKRIYSEPFFLSGNVAHFALVMPIFGDREVAGALVATHSLEDLLRNLVPWWFAEKYRVVMADDKTRWYFGAGRAVRDETGVIVKLHGVAIDLTS